MRKDVNTMIKDIIITTPKTNNQKDGFYVNIDYMYGDADGEVTRTIGPFANTDTEKSYLIQFVNMLEKCLKAYPHGRGGFDTYEDKVPELKLWNIYYDNDDKPTCPKDLEDFIENLNFEWEDEPDDMGGEATITSYNVVYWNQKEQQYYNTQLISK